MTLRYVRSGAGGAATGADWANAYLTLGAAMTAAAAGDTIYVSDDHAETSATSITLTSAGTITSPLKVICVNHSGSVPPVSADIRATATVTTTGNTTIGFGASAASCTFYDGIIFSAGSGNSSATQIVFPTGAGTGITAIFRNCALRLGSTNTAALMAFGGGTTVNSACIELDNTTLQFGNTVQSVSVAGRIKWKNTASAITGASLPTTLFKPLQACGGNVSLMGVDLSAITGTIFGSTSAADIVQFQMEDCKINGSATIAATPSSRNANTADYNRVDSSGTNYKHGRFRFEGTESTEATIVRTGGASDGTQAFAEKIVTTANCSSLFPFEALPIPIWNDTISPTAVTVTVYGIWGGGAVPNNDDIWLEVEYLGASGSPLASFVNDTVADSLAANGALSSDSSTWGGSTTAFKMSVSFTAQQKGWVIVRPKAGKPSSTFYIDPRVVLS